jgi:hypothetical protein
LSWSIDRKLTLIIAPAKSPNSGLRIDSVVRDIAGEARFRAVHAAGGDFEPFLFELDGVPVPRGEDVHDSDSCHLPNGISVYKTVAFVGGELPGRAVYGGCFFASDFIQRDTADPADDWMQEKACVLRGFLRKREMDGEKNEMVRKLKLSGASCAMSGMVRPS